jgi:hypothetical protein
MRRLGIKILRVRRPERGHWIKGKCNTACLNGGRLLKPGLLPAEANIYRFNGVIWLLVGDIRSGSRKSPKPFKIE